MLKIDSIRGNDFYIIGDETLVVGDVVLSKNTEDDESNLFVKKTNIEGIFTYGATQLNDGTFHGKGYVWSSRCGVMNKAFDVALVECLYKKEGDYSYRCCAIDVAHLTELIENMEEYSSCDIYFKPKEKWDTDICYELVSVAKEV